MTDSGTKLVISLATPKFAGRFRDLIAEGSCPPLILFPDEISARGRDCPIIAGARRVEDLLVEHSEIPAEAAGITSDGIALLQPNLVRVASQEPQY